MIPFLYTAKNRSSVGVMGAAVATGISQTVGLQVALTHYEF